MQNLETLNRQFSIAGHLTFIEGAGGMPVARIQNPLASSDIALQGAHLMTWQPKNEAPVVWLSPQARFAPGKSIRGGIPVCWPWFGAHANNASFPAHGFARTVNWHVVSSEALPDGATRIVFELDHTDATRAQWPFPCTLRNIVTIGRELSLELVTSNTGNATFEITEALHTYFDIGDIGDARISGLAGATYLDKLEDFQSRQQNGDIEIDAEIDRVYVDTAAKCVIEDRQRNRRIHIAKQGSSSTVVWNPWVEKAEQMGDMGENGYRRMVCVESANANRNTIGIAPGESHSLIVSYSVEAL